MAYRLYFKDPGMFDKSMSVDSVAEVEEALKENERSYTFACLDDPGNHFKTHGVWTREPGDPWTDHRPNRTVLPPQDAA